MFREPCAGCKATESVVMCLQNLNGSISTELCGNKVNKSKTSPSFCAPYLANFNTYGTEAPRSFQTGS